MNPACLLICNDIADQAQTQFDHWYQTEHLAERLAVPGFSNARRYAAVKASHGWAALYELDNTEVLNGLAYLERLAQPSELTRAVMPHFRRMVRSGLEQQAVVGQGCGGVLDILVMSSQVAAAAVADALIHSWSLHPMFQRLRLLHQPDHGAVSVNATAEAQLRGATDQAWTAVWLLEWATNTSDELPDTQAQALAHGLPLLAAQGGRYRLLKEMKS
ncbi:MAG: hypothetical protein RLZZ566_1439 [Pseudomonadota bacterium]|jgi:hypothetical protein